jgi:hypothetical protein
MSTTLSYAHAKTILSEVEKERIVCTYLNSTEPNAVSNLKENSPSQAKRGNAMQTPLLLPPSPSQKP